MLRENKIISKGKIIAEDTKKILEEGVIVVTSMNRKEIRFPKNAKTTGQKLQSLNLAGVWKNRKIKNGSTFSNQLRKKMGFRSAA